MAFWKIKFDKRKINLFKDVCRVMLTKSVNKSFLLTLSYSGFYDFGDIVSRGWKKVCRVFLLNFFSAIWKEVMRKERGHEEGKELVGHRIGYWLSGLLSSVSSFVCKLVSCVYGSLTLCYLYSTGGSKNRPKTFAGRHLLTNQICILLFYFRA